jgi:hypothetical protein
MVEVLDAAVTENTWPPPIGEVVGLDRAARTLDAYRAEVDRLATLLMRMVEQRYPSVVAQRSLVTPERLARETRDDQRRGVVVAVVD